MGAGQPLTSDPRTTTEDTTGQRITTNGKDCVNKTIIVLLVTIIFCVIHIQTKTFPTSKRISIPTYH